MGKNGDMYVYKNGDVIISGMYAYTYMALEEGWHVQVVNLSEEIYPPIEPILNGIPVVHMGEIPEMKKSGTFSRCIHLRTLSDNFVVPDTVFSVEGMFAESGIKRLPQNFSLPDSVLYAESLFAECRNLECIPDTLIVPPKVTDVTEWFYNCVSLKKLPDDFRLHDRMITAVGFLAGCSSLTELPPSFQFPDSILDVSSFAENCTSLRFLQKSLTIPEAAINYGGVDLAFANCTSLECVPPQLRIQRLFC